MLLLLAFLYYICFHVELGLLALELYSVIAPLLIAVGVFSSVASTATKLKRTSPYPTSMMKVPRTRKIDVDRDLLTSHHITICLSRSGCVRHCQPNTNNYSSKPLQLHAESIEFMDFYIYKVILHRKTCTSC